MRVSHRLENPIDIDGLINILIDSKKIFIEEKFAAAGMDLENFLVQRTSTTDRRIWINIIKNEIAKRLIDA